MNREVVDALLGLLDQGVPIDLPGQFFCLAVHFFQGLIDGHRPDRNRGVAQNPLAGFVDVFTGGQVHDRVRPPANRPDHFLDFFIDGRRHRRVPDIGVDLDQEIPADNHRLQLGMVDIGRDNRAASGDLVTHKFRRNRLGNTGPPGIARMLMRDCAKTVAIAVRLSLLTQLFAGLVFTDGNIFHLRCHHAFARIVHLGHVTAGQSASRAPEVSESNVCQGTVGGTEAAVV